MPSSKKPSQYFTSFFYNSRFYDKGYAFISKLTEVDAASTRS